MVPKLFNKSPLRHLCWSLALVAACSSAFLLIAGCLSLFRDLPLFDNDNLYLSLICALIAGFFVTVFLFGKETLTLPLNNAAPFLENARHVLVEMGYEVAEPSTDVLETRNAFHFLFFCRGIIIHCVDRQAHIAGPKIWVDSLRRRLRLQNFLGGTDLSWHDGSQPGPGLLLKRVQIRMRVSPKDLEKVNAHVVRLLTQEAEVVCEISLLAQSETGIRESTIEQQVRAWLVEQGIDAEIHKDLVKMSEPPSSVLLDGKRLADAARRAIAKN